MFRGEMKSYKSDITLVAYLAKPTLVSPHRVADHFCPIINICGFNCHQFHVAMWTADAFVRRFFLTTSVQTPCL